MMILAVTIGELMMARDPANGQSGCAKPDTRIATPPHIARGEDDPQRFQDQQLAQAVHRTMMAIDSSRLGPISVSVWNGCVRLTGRVSTYYAKQLALHAALGVDGVIQVSDDVEVE